MTQRNKKKEEGFILIYVLIALLAVSLVMVPFLQIKDLETTDISVKQNFAIPDNIRQEINHYALKNGHYPAPANPALSPEDIGFGIPVTGFTATCNNGGTETRQNVVCTPGRRDTTNPIEDTVVPSTGAITNSNTANDPVLIGALPVSVLGLAPDMAYDQYGHKLTYAVTKFMTQTTQTNFRNNIGVIGLNNELGVVHEKTLGNNIHYIIVNHGSDGVGAYVGSTKIPCNPPSGFATATETENCDNNSVFVALRGVDETTGQITASSAKEIGEYQVLVGNQYYDDGLAFSDTLFNGAWGQLNPNDVFFTSSQGNPNISLVSTLTSVPPTDKITITGSAKMNSFVGDRLCSPAKNNCFKINNIVSSLSPSATVSPTTGGTLPNEEKPLKCTTQTGLTKVGLPATGGSVSAGYAVAQCSDYAPQGALTNECPVNYAKGIKKVDDKWELICF